jgi:homoserine kinase
VSARVTVRAPATSANLGPGFDALGLALARYDQIDVAAAPSGVQVEVDGEGAGEVPVDEKHLVVRAIRAGLDALGADQPGLVLRCRNTIPHGRGLGSSAAAIVAGVAAAYGLTGTPLDRDRALETATELEGHPDNVAACLYGGLTVAWMESGTARAARLEPDPGIRPVVLVPDTALSTEVARGLLPASVPHADAAANSGRAALLVAALTARPDLLPAATEDRLHQPYRAPAMPVSAGLLDRLRADGVAAVISGAGPTVLALLTGDDPVPDPPDGWQAWPLAIDLAGVQLS